MIFVFQSTTIKSQTGFENSLHREKRKSRHFDFEEVKNNIDKIRRGLHRPTVHKSLGLGIRMIHAKIMSPFVAFFSR